MPRARVFRRTRPGPGGKTITEKWFTLDYDAPDGSRVVHLARPKTTSKKFAEEILQREMAVAWGPGGGAPAGTGKTVGDLLDEYDTYLSQASPSTWKNLRDRIRWWKGRLGSKPASALRPGDVEKALLELAQARAEATVAGYLTMLRAALRRAVRDGDLASDPCGQLSVSYGYPERHVTWEEDELARVRAAAPPWCSDLLEFLRATGIRVGDALTLRWDQVREDRIRLLEGQEKTGEPLEVPLSARGRAVLERLPRSPKSPLLFPGQRHGPRAYNRVLRVVQDAMKAADPPVTGKTIHDLRRTWAVELLEAGTSLELIAALLGQRTTRVAGRYAKARFTALKAVVERVGG